MTNTFAAVGSAAFLLLACPAFGDSIVFGTGVPGTIETNSLTGVNISTIPAPEWHSALGSSVWESTQANSLNPAIPNGTLVDFRLEFNVTGTPTGGTMAILVDDNALAIFNGYTLFDNRTAPLGVNCSSTLPNCVNPRDLDITSDLVAGQNRLDIWVQQSGSFQFGLDVFGTVTSEADEPGTEMIAGLGIFFIAASRFRRRWQGN